MVAGLEDPSAGSIHIGSTDITYVKPYRRPVNTVFQSYALFPHLTVWENVAFGLKRRRSGRRRQAGRRRPGTHRTGRVGLAQAGQLSGGQQQRVALARAIVNAPRCCCSTSRSARWT